MKTEAVFFDLGDTLGTAVIGGPPPRLVGFDIFPYSLGVLAGLKNQQLKVGLISNTGTDKGAAMDAVLAPTGLLRYVDAALRVYSADEGVTKDFPELFHRAARRAGLDAQPRRNLFVGENAHERQVAASAGWLVCPHPMLVGEVLAGQALRYVRLAAPSNHPAAWQDALQNHAFVRIHGPGQDSTGIYGLTSQRVALELMNMQFGIEFLGEPDLPLSRDLFPPRDA